MTRVRVRAPNLFVKTKRGEKISMLTAYDATMGKLFDRAGVDALSSAILSEWSCWVIEITITVRLEAMIHDARGRAQRRRALLSPTCRS
jgi:ketopantoate hydroxymethyltransferase